MDTDETMAIPPTAETMASPLTADTPDHARAGTRSPLKPTGQQTAKARKFESRHPPIAPSSETYAQLLLERSTAVPIKRFDSADYFLNQHVNQQKAEAVRAATSSRRRQAESQSMLPSPTPPQHSTRFPDFAKPFSPSQLSVAYSCKVSAGSPASDTDSDDLTPGSAALVKPSRRHLQGADTM